MHVGDVEVNFRPRNNKMSESVSTDGWGGHSGDTMGLWLRRPLLTVIIVSHQYLPSFWGQKINDSHNMIGDHFMSYA